jgi:hypothetical protein
MTIVEREEKYLLMLRRATLGFARLLLVLSAVALIGGIGLYAWAEFSAAREFALPSQTALSATVDPCSYLINADADTNGRDSEGPIPVKRVLSKCDTTAVTLPTFENPAKARAAFAVDMVETQKALGWSYRDEAAGFEELRTHAEKIEQAVLVPVENSTPAQQLVVSTALAGYSARLRKAASPSAAWLQLEAEGSPSSEEQVLGAPKPKVDRSVVAHLTDLRFVRNQLAVTVRQAKSAHDDALATAVTLKASAVMAAYASAALFACFLMLMLVFVFIKIEVDLRDIRDGIKEYRAIV